MTSYFELTTPTTQAFSFRPVLDGTTYNVTVPWSLFGQRYYVTCQTLSGDLVFNVPLIGSPSGQDIYSLSWEPNTVTVTTSIPHGFKPGTLVNLTIAGVLPASYDGLHSCLRATNAKPLPIQQSSAPVLTGGLLHILITGFKAIHSDQ